MAGQNKATHIASPLFTQTPPSSTSFLAANNTVQDHKSDRNLETHSATTRGSEFENMIVTL
jgi:hypothetical protein